jgi:hypothetical protein
VLGLLRGLFDSHYSDEALRQVDLVQGQEACAGASEQSVGEAESRELGGQSAGSDSGSSSAGTSRMNAGGEDGQEQQGKGEDHERSLRQGHQERGEGGGLLGSLQLRVWWPLWTASKEPAD